MLFGTVTASCQYPDGENQENYEKNNNLSTWVLKILKNLQSNEIKKHPSESIGKEISTCLINTLHRTSLSW